VDSVTPGVGAWEGGTHIHISGDGFAVDTYGGSNQVFIGTPDFDYLINSKTQYDEETYLKDGVWAKCDVIEGACTVDCGGVRKVRNALTVLPLITSTYRSSPLSPPPLPPSQIVCDTTPFLFGAENSAEFEEVR
jgi:hypothetical protein